MSNNFLGESKHTLENGCRLIIPLRFRNFLQPEFVLFKSPDGCVSMYDIESFNDIMSQLRGLAGTKEGRAQIRVAMRAARYISPDKQGRFTIPADYISYASLGETVYLIGAGNKVEIWSEEDYIKQGGNEELTPDKFPEIFY